MTVPSSTNKIVGAGNGVTTSWPFSFAAFADSHLSVIYTDAEGGETTLDSSAYTVSRNSDQAANPGGTVAYSPAIATGTKLTILRVVPYTQATDIKNQGGYFPEVLERALDLLAMQVQQVKEQLARSIKISPSQSAIGELEATDENRASMLLGFDADGNLAVVSGGASAAVSVAMQAVVGAASLAAARTAMGLGALAPLNTINAAGLIDANLITLDKLVNATGPVFVGRVTGTSGARSDLTPSEVLAALLASSALRFQGVNGLMASTAAFSKEVIGLTYSNNSGDATNDLDHTAGACADSTGAAWGKLAAMTKRSDATWTVGTGGGALDTGAVGNNDYFIHTVINPTTGAADVLYSLSLSSPTMALPAAAGFTLFRPTGWFKRLGGAIREFQVDELSGGGIRYRADSPILDGSAVGLTTTYAAITLTSVPAGLRVLAFGNLVAPTGGLIAHVRPVGAQDGTPSHTAGPLATAGSTGTSTTTGGPWREITDTSRQVEWAANSAGNAYLTNAGFEWSRR